MVPNEIAQSLTKFAIIFSLIVLINNEYGLSLSEAYASSKHQKAQIHYTVMFKKWSM